MRADSVLNSVPDICPAITCRMESFFLPLRMTTEQPCSAAIQAASTLAIMPPRPLVLLLANWISSLCTSGQYVGMYSEAGSAGLPVNRPSTSVHSISRSAFSCTANKAASPSLSRNLFLSPSWLPSTFRRGIAERMASFSLKTGMTFMDKRSSAVAVSASRNPSCSKSEAVTNSCAACMSIMVNRLSYSAISPVCPAAAAALGVACRAPGCASMKDAAGGALSGSSVASILAAA
mmetsp:Transcript_6822/g.19670  ORF Transcript_6822/g.19670 Transcript_6822/m.19670 type:complete len:234 (-) Transcript_6822:761-1462(-)